MAPKQQPNFAVLFAEAISQSARDYYHAHRELMTPGYWQVRLRKHTPYIPCRTYESWSEPGNPDNLLDRWPLPLLMGEIIGESCDPADIFACPERRAIQPLVTPARTFTVEQHYAYLVADAKHAAKYRSEWDPLGNPFRKTDLTKMPPLF